MIKKYIFILLVFLFGAFFLLSLDYSKPKDFSYGVSFSRFHADELKLDWKQTYLAILNDLKVRDFRFSAHWPSIEPNEGKYDFKDLDFQMEEAKKAGTSVILAVGRRLPGWPECHEPDWAKDLAQDKKKELILKLVEAVTERYKSYPNIKYWQVENEPYLDFFGKQACGNLDEELLKKEIELVRKIDPSRSILVTDSGEFGTWYQSYQRGDVFGTSMYLYVWWRNFIGPLRYPITPGFFRIKHNLMKLIYGDKPSMIIELSAEPWLLQPILDTPLDVQFSRMDLDKFNEIINFSKKTSFNTFYLWGAEWWYWLKLNGHPELWDRAKQLWN